MSLDDATKGLSAMRPEDVSPEASAALTRAFDADQVIFHSCLGTGAEALITFRSEDAFQAWLLVELAEHERQVRAKVAAEIEAAARECSVHEVDGMHAAVEVARGDQP